VEEFPAVGAFFLHLLPFKDAILAEELFAVFACHWLVEEHLTYLTYELIHVGRFIYVCVGEVLEDKSYILLWDDF
jgi:hypothetical protein